MVSNSCRILLCCEHYSPSVGGVQEVMRQIAERLVSRGFEVCVATSVHPQRPAETVLNGVRVISFAILGNKVKGLTGPVAEFQNFIRNGCFDTILIKAAQQWTFDAAIDVIPLIDAKKVFIPCGFSGLHDPRYRIYFDRMPKWLREFDELIFYASDYQDINFARQHGLTKIKLIPNGVDEREFMVQENRQIRERLGIPAQNDLILSVGSRIMAKGHWEVLEAFRLAQLKRPTTLVLNGNSPNDGYYSKLKRFLKHAIRGRWPLTWKSAYINKLSFKKVLITDLARSDLVELYGASDLFVFASHIEYSPLVLFEASAAGLPFISSSAGNSAEIVKWLGGGTIVESKSGKSAEVDPMSLANAIEVVLSDRVKLRFTGALVRRSIFERGFVWTRIVDDYIKVLKPCLLLITTFALTPVSLF